MRDTRPAARYHPYGDEALGREVLAGLSADPKTIAPKFFYDDRGAWLFEQICEQPEYYLTRAELEILERHAGDIAALAGPRCAVVEYGSGAGVKIRLLLEALDRPVSYTPVDISRRQLGEVAAALGREYHGIATHPVCADYTRRFDLPRLPAHDRKIAFFPGSTIGNFHPVHAVSFLQHVRHAIGRRGALVLGVDRRKDTGILDAAYNDAAGVTAEFNLNVLEHLNRVLDADFDPGCFRHVAFFNEQASRVEMHLESLARQTVQVAGESICLAYRERIWTESSYKYDLDGLEALAAGAGFEVAQLFTDRGERFWVAVLLPAV